MRRQTAPWFLSWPLVLAGCAYGVDEDVGTAEQPIVEGTDDVVVFFDDPHRVAADHPRQWARDATVAITDGCGSPASERGGNAFCSGVLVAPNVVLTNHHCVQGGPAIFVTFSPRHPQSTGLTGLLDVPERVCLPVIACMAHYDAGGGCFTGSSSNIERDLVALILDRRVDHGLTGQRTQGYRAIPALIQSSEPDNPDDWDQELVRHAGYGPVDGRVGNQCPPWTLPELRQFRDQRIVVGRLLTTAISLLGAYGRPSDSGGPYYRAEFDLPQVVLAVHRGAGGQLPTATST